MINRFINNGIIIVSCSFFPGEDAGFYDHINQEIVESVADFID